MVQIFSSARTSGKRACGTCTSGKGASASGKWASASGKWAQGSSDGQEAVCECLGGISGIGRRAVEVDTAWHGSGGSTADAGDYGQDVCGLGAA